MVLIFSQLLQRKFLGEIYMTRFLCIRSTLEPRRRVVPLQFWQSTQWTKNDQRRKDIQGKDLAAHELPVFGVVQLIEQQFVN